MKTVYRILSVATVALLLSISGVLADESCSNCPGAGPGCEWTQCEGGGSGCPTCTYECDEGQVCTYEPCEFESNCSEPE